MICVDDHSSQRLLFDDLLETAEKITISKKKEKAEQKQWLLKAKIVHNNEANNDKQIRMHSSNTFHSKTDAVPCI